MSKQIFTHVPYMGQRQRMFGMGWVDEHLPFVVRVCLHPLAVVDCVRRIQHLLVRGLEHFRVTVRSSNYR